MKKHVFTLLLVLPFAFDSQAQSSQNIQAINWQNFSTSSTALGNIHFASKPLQYNDELDLISFVQRTSPYYPTSPAPTSSAITGVIVGFTSTNWGTNWDSTCIWSNNNYWGRYPQGGVYNPPGNLNLANAYLVGTGPSLDVNLTWAGNWAASKQIGPGSYNTTASTVSNAQQMLSSVPPLPVFGKCNFARNSFSTSDDGNIRSLARLGTGLSAADYNGVMVLKGNFSSGVFNWTGDSIVGFAAYNSQFQKVMGEPVMAWNESGTIGYVVFPGSRYGSVGSNVGIQPIVYRSLNSGSTWEIMPAMDFDSPSAAALKKFLPGVNPSNPNPNLTIPNMQTFEGYDAVVDKNNALHVACVLNGAEYSSIDSMFNRRSYGSEEYNWKHSPGRRPYLVDFILHQDKSWIYGVVDSLSSEMPGLNASDPGILYNLWGTGSVTDFARVQCSRTPDGRFISITWAESDTTMTNSGVKWNSLPDVKARLIDANNYNLSPTEINLSVGTNTNISGKSSLHYAAPRCATATLSANTFDIKLPVTISNNPFYNGLTTTSHWFSSAELNFSNLTVPFTQSVSNVSVGMNEITHVEGNLFEVYPNPSASVFKLRRLNTNSGLYTVELFDVSGRRLYSQNSNVAEFELNVTSLEAGTYMIRISSDEGITHKKIIKE